MGQIHLKNQVNQNFKHFWKIFQELLLSEDIFMVKGWHGIECPSNSSKKD